MAGGMTDWTVTFEAERPRLVGIAYRTLCSVSDAEDVVQEAWLRCAGVDLATIDNPAAWLTTVTSRLALDRLRVLSRRREDYVGPWLPEPVGSTSGSTSGSMSDPSLIVERADSLTLGFLVLLDRLSPTERVVFLLADVFGEPYSRIAEAVDKSEEACRQVASRARRRLRGDAPTEVRAADKGLLEALVTAIVMGDDVGVMALLAPDVRLVSDGGAARHAARRPVLGPDRVARLLVNLGARMPSGGEPGWRVLNGQDAFTVMVDGVPDFVFLADCDADSGRIVAVRIVSNPDKLGHVDDPVAML
jgi:RNA polymerase sigma-70 factor (ECF subfamily)